MPGFDAKLPLQLSPVDGVYALNSDFREVIKQDLKMLLLTNPGERVMDARYGCGLRQLIFENNTGDLRAEAQRRVASQVSKYLPQVRVEEFFFETSDENEELSDNAARIYIRFFVPSLSFSAEINFDTFTGVK